MTDSQKLDLILGKINVMDDRLCRVEETMKTMDARLYKVEEAVETMGARLCKVEETIETMDCRLCNVEETTKVLTQRMGKVEVKIDKLEIILENETNRNIQIIAESHLNLDRKLDEALKSSQLNTLYHLRVNRLDGELKNLQKAAGLV